MKILQVVDNFINLENVIKVVVEDDKNQEGTVKFQYKDTRGDWYTSSLKRKDSYIADPLNAEMIKSAYMRAVQYLAGDVNFANLSNFVDDEEETNDDED